MKSHDLFEVERVVVYLTLGVSESVIRRQVEKKLLGRLTRRIPQKRLKFNERKKKGVKIKLTVCSYVKCIISHS